MTHPHPRRDAAAVSPRALRSALAAVLAAAALAAAQPAEAQTSSRLGLTGSARSSARSELASSPGRRARAEPRERTASSSSSSRGAKREHTVSEGESLWGIARRYEVSVEALQSANDLEGTTIRAGRKLSIPRSVSASAAGRGRAAVREHTVADGESLWAIARRYDLHVDEIQEANDLDDVTIRPGQKLRIPRPSQNDADEAAPAPARRTAAAAARETEREERTETTRRAARPTRREREESSSSSSEKREEAAPSRSAARASRPSSAPRTAAAREEREESRAGESRSSERRAPESRTAERREASAKTTEAARPAEVLRSASRARAERGASTAHLRESRLLVPVAGISATQLRNSYDQARSGGRIHDAIDIHAPRGTPVVAVTDARVLRFHEGSRGGNSVYLLDDDGRTRYYYAHLDRYAEGLSEGDRVTRGQVIGYVGDTGNAQPGDYHLHFSIALLNSTARWWQGENVNPYPLLRDGETVEK